MPLTNPINNSIGNGAKPTGGSASSNAKEEDTEETKMTDASLTLPKVPTPSSSAVSQSVDDLNASGGDVIRFEMALHQQEWQNVPDPAYGLYRHHLVLEASHHPSELL